MYCPIRHDGFGCKHFVNKKHDDECNFGLNQMIQDRIGEYSFLENIKKNHRVIRLDDLICDDSQCKTHIDSIWLFRDKAHLSYAGSWALGNRLGFFNMIVGED